MECHHTSFPELDIISAQLKHRPRTDRVASSFSGKFGCNRWGNRIPLRNATNLADRNVISKKRRILEHQGSTLT